MPRLEYQLWLRLDGARDAWALVGFFASRKEAEADLDRREAARPAGPTYDYKVVKVEVVL